MVTFGESGSAAPSSTSAFILALPPFVPLFVLRISPTSRYFTSSKTTVSLSGRSSSSSAALAILASDMNRLCITPPNAAFAQASMLIPMWCDI